MCVPSSRHGKAPSLLLAAAILGGPTQAMAEPPKVPPWHLEYVRTPGTRLCPEEKSMRRVVAARIGYDPFKDDAPRSVRVTIVHTPERLEALIEARDENGQITATPKAWAPLGECRELLENTAVFLVDIVKPFVLPSPQKPEPPGTSTTPAPPVAPSPSPTPVPAPPAATLRAQEAKRPAPPRAAPARSPWVPKLAVSLGAGATWWTAPQTSMSLSTGFAARWPSLSIGVEGRFDYAWRLPTKQQAGGYIVGGAVIGCGYPGLSSHRAFVKGCLLGDLARLETSADSLVVPDGAATIVNIGVRVGGGFWLYGPLGIELQADAVYVAHRPTIWLDQTQTWRLPSANLGIRVGLVGLFDIL